MNSASRYRMTYLGQLRIIRMLAAILVLTCPASVLAEPALLDQYVLNVWTHELRAVATDIYAIAQDDDGYLWLGTNNGVVRFDGVRFTRFDQEQLAASTSVYKARDGSIWLGSFGPGVTRVNGDQIQRYGSNTGFVGRRVNQFAEDAEGMLFAASRTGLFRFSGDRWERLETSHGLPSEGPVYTIHRDADGALWVGTSTGVFRRNRGEQRFRLVDASTQYYFPEFAELPEHSIWITDPHRGFRKLAPTGGSAHAIGTSPQGVGSKLISDHAGHLWVATEGQGLWFIKDPLASPSSVDIASSATGFPSDTVLSVFEDREQNIWVGARGALYQLSRRRITVPIDTALRSAQVVVAGPGQEMWLGVGQRLARVSPSDIRWYGPTGCAGRFARCMSIPGASRGSPRKRASGGSSTVALLPFR